MKLTVVQTLPALDMGGVERGTVEIARALVEAGHRSIVIAAGGRLVEQLINEGSEHVNWAIGRKSLLTLRYIAKLRHLLHAEHVDILHARSRLPAWISYLAWRSLSENDRTRFITTMHGAHSVGRYSKIMTRGERVIAVSEFIRNHILENYPDTDPAHISVIPRGVDPSQFPYGYQPPADWLAEWRRHRPELAVKKLITLPARLTRRKGHEVFINIMRALHQRNPEIHGLIVGGRDPKRRAYADELEKSVKKAGLTQCITFLGHRDDLREIMAISHIVVILSSKPESFGRTAVEALSLGVPVAAYAHGGTAEILQALYPEGLISPGDSHAAVKCLGRLLENPPPISGQNYYTLAAMQAATLKLYAQCVQSTTVKG